MIEFNNSEVLVSFPALHQGHSRHSLRVFFTGVDSYANQIPFTIEPGRPLCLTGLGRFMVHFRPGANSLAYAILMDVDGINAITGDHSRQLKRMPQNYFASPPQGGVDGFFRDGAVQSLYACPEYSVGSPILRIKFHPVKRETEEHWYPTRILCGSEPRHRITGLTLEHGGNRPCEPIYEDLCTIGDWDQTVSDEFSIFLAPQH